MVLWVLLDKLIDMAVRLSTRQTFNSINSPFDELEIRWAGLRRRDRRSRDCFWEEVLLFSPSGETSANDSVSFSGFCLFSLFLFLRCLKMDFRGYFFLPSTHKARIDWTKSLTWKKWGEKDRLAETLVSLSDGDTKENATGSFRSVSRIHPPLISTNLLKL